MLASPFSKWEALFGSSGGTGQFNLYTASGASLLVAQVTVSKQRGGLVLILLLNERFGYFCWESGVKEEGRLSICTSSRSLLFANCYF